MGRALGEESQGGLGRPRHHSWGRAVRPEVSPSVPSQGGGGATRLDRTEWTRAGTYRQESPEPKNDPCLLLGSVSLRAVRQCQVKMG